MPSRWWGLGPPQQFAGDGLRVQSMQTLQYAGESSTKLVEVARRPLLSTHTKGFELQLERR